MSIDTLRLTPAPLSGLMYNRYGFVLGLWLAMTIAAQSQTADRAKLLQWFDELKTQSISQGNHSGAKQLDTTKPGSGDLRAPKLAIKLWVKQAIEVDGNWTPGRPLNLAIHKWQPSEPFYLSVETATPIHLSFVSMQPGQTPRLISPDPLRPDTFAPIMPGRVWTSAMMRLGDHRDTEMIEWIAVPATPGQQAGLLAGPADVTLETSARLMLVRMAHGEPRDEVISAASATLTTAQKARFTSLVSLMERTKASRADWRLAYVSDFGQPQRGRGGRNPVEACQVVVGISEIGHGQLRLEK